VEEVVSNIWKGGGEKGMKKEWKIYKRERK